MNDWFARWFGQEYLELYSHRDDSEARKATALVRDTLGGTLGGADVGRILDLACGSGRHTRVLREWAWTVGLDLSATLLDVAERAAPGAPYVRGDMRALPFEDHAFGLVVNLFTSFGYFDFDAQHLRVLAEVARVTRRGGAFVLDYLNAEQVRRGLAPRDENVVNGRRVVQERRISGDGRYVEKTITADGCAQTFQERVRLFAADDLVMMLEESGFAVTRTFGDYDGGPATTTSPRVILFAERE